MAERPDEPAMIRYLLADLPVPQTEELDELSVTDDQFAQRLRAVEEDLVDSYARGELSGETLKRFEAHYLASPMRREKVRFAEAFLGFSGRTATAPVNEMPARDEESTQPRRSTPGRTSWLGFNTPRQAWAVAAAVLVLLAGGGYLALENQRLRSHLAGAQAERAALQQREQELERQIEENRSEGAKTADELEAVRERLAEIERQAQDGQKGKPEGAGAGPVAFTLPPPTRGAATLPTLAIPPQTRLITLQLELETDAFPAYQATLKNPMAGQALWRSDKVRSVRKGQHEVVSVKLRTSLLGPGIYHVELAGIQQGKPGEIIATYPFRVVIQ